MSASLAGFVASFLAEEAIKFAGAWAKKNASDLGEWRGKAIKIPQGGGLYRIVCDPEDPLRFYSYRTKLEYRTKMDFICDLGSIPPMLRGVGGELLALEPEDFWKSYWLHDGLYEEAGVWVRDPSNPDSIWVFVDSKRVHADILLYWCLSAEGANNATLKAVYEAVRVGAGIPWRNHRKHERGPDGLS
jgi:hypothetical protein